MHTQSIEKWRHDHVFLGTDHRRNERRTWAVIALTASMMVTEIMAGTVSARWRFSPTASTWRRMQAR
jgi:Co/Zn/Cd efflux system component